MSQSLATGDHEAVLAKLTELIDEIQFAMLTTVEADGTLRSRPMATHRNPGKICDGTLWFFTKGNAPKADEVRDDQHVNLSYASPGQNKYVSLSGKAFLIHNRAKFEEFWKPEYKAWFPKGIDDPELALLRVIISKAEYWDTPGSSVVHAIGLIKAVATGQQYQPGDHEKVEL
jgi:general stress protein 26